MKPKHKDLAGQRFGRLLVLERAGTSHKRSALRSCACDCGAMTVRQGQSLCAGAAQSCGCLRKERVAEANAKRLRRHGETVGGQSRTYRAWCAMVARCTNPKSDAYPWYGGRGVSVCERWLDFELFMKDMGRAPDGMSIERTNYDGNYEPGNCRWATKIEQANNTRANVFLEWNGRKLTVAQWCRELGLKPATVYRRLKLGWSVDRALSTCPSEYRRAATCAV